MSAGKNVFWLGNKVPPIQAALLEQIYGQVNIQYVTEEECGDAKAIAEFVAQHPGGILYLQTYARLPIEALAGLPLGFFTIYHGMQPIDWYPIPDGMWQSTSQGLRLLWSCLQQRSATA
jgi:hypothetical protein